MGSARSQVGRRRGPSHHCLVSRGTWVGGTPDAIWPMSPGSMPWKDTASGIQAFTWFCGSPARPLSGRTRLGPLYRSLPRTPKRIQVLRGQDGGHSRVKEAQETGSRGAAGVIWNIPSYVQLWSVTCQESASASGAGGVFCEGGRRRHAF